MANFFFLNARCPLKYVSFYDQLGNSPTRPPPCLPSGNIGFSVVLVRWTAPGMSGDVPGWPAPMPWPISSPILAIEKSNSLSKSISGTWIGKWLWKKTFWLYTNGYYNSCGSKDSSNIFTFEISALFHRFDHVEATGSHRKPRCHPSRGQQQEVDFFSRFTIIMIYLL